MAKRYRPYLPAQDRPAAAAQPARLAAGEPPEVFRQRRHRSGGFERDRSVLRTGRARLPIYHPRMMTKLLVYGYCVGVFSSRRLQKRLQEDVAFRVLAAGNEPDCRTISDSRKLHLAALDALF